MLSKSLQKIILISIRISCTCIYNKKDTHYYYYYKMNNRAAGQGERATHVRGSFLQLSQEVLRDFPAVISMYQACNTHSNARINKLHKL